MLNSVRGNKKESGKICKIKNGNDPKSCSIEEVPLLLDNLFNYMNDKYIDSLFINLAISHF